MTKQHIIVFLFAFLLPLASYADETVYEKNYRLRSCNTSGNVCKEFDSVLLVNPEKRTISYSVYQEGKLLNNQIFSGCQFFSE